MCDVNTEDGQKRKRRRENEREREIEVNQKTYGFSQAFQRGAV